MDLFQYPSVLMDITTLISSIKSPLEEAPRAGVLAAAE